MVSFGSTIVRCMLVLLAASLVKPEFYSACSGNNLQLATDQNEKSEQEYAPLCEKTLQP